MTTEPPVPVLSPASPCPFAWLKKLALVGWLLLWPLFLAVFLSPVRQPVILLCMIGCVGGIWAGTLWLAWKLRWLRAILILMFILATMVLCLPGRRTNQQELRDATVRSLRQYVDTPYVWGGETRRGVDCSGLVRCGLYDAEMRMGVRTLNPALLRNGLSLWWNDCSAHALKDGYQNRTQLITRAPSINALDHQKIQPGDFAITSNGVHALAYLGSGTWIEADPGPLRKVILLQEPSPRNIWFRMPVHLMRWRDIQGE